MYSEQFQGSLKAVEAARAANVAYEPARMTAQEKDDLLAAYHPDYKKSEFATLKVGPNKGESVPHELCELLQAHSRISADDVDLNDVRYDVDVLIIGGGFSGSWAALTARQHVENVLIVDKGPRDWGGLGGMSGGDMIVKQPEFAAKDLVEELVYYYDGLCEQDVLEEILNQSYERFKDYEKMGHEFARDDSGRLMSIPQRGLELMRYYFYHPYGKGGAHTTQILNAELQRLNVQRLGRIEITDLVKDGDAVSGAVGFHAQSGAPCLFRAKAVILAAHNGGWKGSYLLNTCAGEGAALAYGAVCRPLCQELGLAQTAFDILLFLANNPTYKTARDIVEVRHIKANLVSIHVDRLVREGYLTRQAVAGDRRKVELRCTDRARPVIERGRALQSDFFDGLMAGIDEPTRAAFFAAMARMEQNLDKILEETK